MRLTDVEWFLCHTLIMGRNRVCETKKQPHCDLLMFLPNCTITWLQRGGRGCANVGWCPAASRGPGSAWPHHWPAGAARPAASGDSYSRWTGWFPPYSPVEIDMMREKWSISPTLVKETDDLPGRTKEGVTLQNSRRLFQHHIQSTMYPVQRSGAFSQTS